MNIADLKLDLINKITAITDFGVVEELKHLLNFELSKSEYKISVQQKNKLMEARAEYKAGKVLPEEIANEEIDKWLAE